MTPFWTFVAPLGAPERKLYVQIQPFQNTRKSQKSTYWVQNALYLKVTTQMDHSGSNLVHLGYLVSFSGVKRPDHEQLGLQNSLICSYMDLWEYPGGPKRSKKEVSCAFPVNIGQLDCYIVFGIKSGAVQDIQRGKKCPLGVKQTPLDHRWPPLNPPKTPPNLPRPFQ